MKSEHPRGAQLVLILAALMVSLLLSALDSTIVGTAMKTIINELKGMDLYSWPFTIYMLCSTIVIPISGGLSDIFGRKPIFLIGIVTFLFGSLMCGVSHSMAWLIAFRGIQGLGGGIINTGVFTIVADLFPPQLRGKYMGIVTSVFGISSIVGPLVGGLITDYLNWRWIFYVNLPIGIIALLLVIFMMPNFKTTGDRRRVDYPGAVLIVFTLVPLLLAFSFAGTTYGWASPQIIGLFAVSLLMLLFFIRVELRAQNPIIPMSFFKDRTIWITLLTGFLSNAVMYAAIMYIPYFVQGILGTTATTSGAVTVPMTLALMVTANVVGVVWSSKANYYRLLSIVAFVLCALGMILLSSMTEQTSYVAVILFMVILGAGVGITMPITNSNVQNGAPIEQLSAATGTVQFFRTIGSTVGSAIFGTIMSTSMNRGFGALNLSNLPQALQSALKNPQVITDKGALTQLLSSVPTESQDAVSAAVTASRGVMSTGIQHVFLFCALAAVVGILLSLFFKAAPMTIIHLRPAADAAAAAAPVSKTPDAP